MSDKTLRKPVPNCLRVPVFTVPAERKALPLLWREQLLSFSGQQKMFQQI
jgi:hypothetical protein